MSFRDRLDVELLLRELGIAFTRRGSVLRALCPHPDHVDHKPSWSIVDSPKTRKHGGHRCFSCGFGGGPWELVMAVRGVDQETAFEYIGSLVLNRPREFDGMPRVVVRTTKRGGSDYVLPFGVVIPSLDGSEMPEVFASYLDRRGVTQWQIERWRIGYARRGRLAWRVVIPVHTRGRLVAHVARAVFADRDRYDMPYAGSGARPTCAVFGEPLIDESLETLTIAEGSFSCLALERAGAPNPVALLGSDWSPEKAAILSAGQWRTVIIATDPDPAGDKVARAIAGSFRRSKIVRLNVSKSPDDCGLIELQGAIASALA